MQKNISKPRKRKPSQHHNEQMHLPLKTRNRRKNLSVLVVCVLILAVLGAGITYFLAGNNTTSLFIGALIGAGIGFLFGIQIVKGLSREKEL